MKITVKHICNHPQYAYEAKLHIGNGGKGVYGATAEEAEAKLRKLYDCEGIVATYPETKLVPVSETGYGLTPEDKKREAIRKARAI